MKITRKLSKQISLCKISMNFVSRDLLIYWRSSKLMSVQGYSQHTEGKISAGFSPEQTHTHKHGLNPFRWLSCEHQGCEVTGGPRDAGSLWTEWALVDKHYMNLRQKWAILRNWLSRITCVSHSASLEGWGNEPWCKCLHGSYVNRPAKQTESALGFSIFRMTLHEPPEKEHSTYWCIAFEIFF